MGVCLGSLHVFSESAEGLALVMDPQTAPLFIFCVFLTLFSREVTGVMEPACLLPNLLKFLWWHLSKQRRRLRSFTSPLGKGQTQTYPFLWKMRERKGGRCLQCQMDSDLPVKSVNYTISNVSVTNMAVTRQTLSSLRQTYDIIFYYHFHFNQTFLCSHIAT